MPKHTHFLAEKLPTPRRNHPTKSPDQTPHHRASPLPTALSTPPPTPPPIPLPTPLPAALPALLPTLLPDSVAPFPTPLLANQANLLPPLFLAFSRVFFFYSSLALFFLLCIFGKLSKHTHTHMAYPLAAPLRPC